MIMFTNETCKDASITASSTLTQYPPSNLVNSILQKVFRTGTTADVVFDAGSAVTVDSVLIANHNISSGVTTLKIQGNATNVWTSPSVDETITYSSGIIRHQFTAASYRYWRIYIVDASNPDGYLEMGRAWVGDSYECPGIGTTVTEVRITADVKSRSISGQTYNDRRYNYSQFITTFPAVNHTDKESIIEQFDSVTHGEPIFIYYDEDCIDLDVYYVTIDQSEIRFTILGNTDYYTASINFVEEK